MPKKVTWKVAAADERVHASMRPYIEQARAKLMSAAPPLPEDAAIWAWLDGPCSESPAPRFALNTFSPCFFAKGFGYGPRAPLVGPWMYSEEECLDTQLPEGLASFLNSCERPPAYVGFGSMSINGAAAWTKLVVAALHALDPERKHIISSGWAGLCLDALDAADPEYWKLSEWAARHVFFIDGHVQHAWLLPRCGMAVHHGGAGTTQAAARAGLPQVIVPLLADQPLWGLALEEYGAGVRVQKFLADPSLTAGELCAAMRQADSADLKAAARRLRAEMLLHGDGRENAMRFLQSMVACQNEP